jgi:hypothetical protein
MANMRNPLLHESVVYSLPAAIIASALSSALVMWQTGAPTDKVLRVALPNVTIFLLLWLWNARPWSRRGFVFMTWENPPLPAKAVVAMVSKGGGSQTAVTAVAFHSKTLEHVWLITTPTAKADAESVSAQIAALKAGVTIHPITFVENTHTIEEVKPKVEGIRREALKQRGVWERDLICDFTGLTKQASAGMVLACAHRAARFQYIRAEWDDAGRPVPPGSPVEVGVAYQVAAEPDEG